jgi:hypothetical protein
MDVDRFDRLTRRLAAPQTRRGLLPAVVGLVLLARGLVVPVSPAVVAAREGAYGGRLGGRHGQNRRGRDQDQDHDPGTRHHTKHQTPNTTTAPPPPTCAESCAGTCAFCVHGPGAPTRCVSSPSSLNIFCSIGCASDDYCQTFRPDFPSCVSGWVNRTTGQVTQASDGCAGIAPPSLAYCSQINPCA